MLPKVRTRTPSILCGAKAMARMRPLRASAGFAQGCEQVENSGLNAIFGPVALL